MISFRQGFWLGCCLVFATSVAGCGGDGGPGNQDVSHMSGSAVVSPAGLSYSTPSAVYSPGEKITPNIPSSSGGPISTYSVSPALPDGLVLDQQTGVVNGAPVAATPSAIYTVTGSNAQGSVTARLQIEVKAITAAPATLAYQNPFMIFTAGQAVTGIVPATSGGRITQFTISPALPGGLVLDPVTGEIGGTPATVSGPVSYRVTGSNSAGNVTAQVTLEVRAAIAPPMHLEYSSRTVSYTVGQVITPNLPQSTGGNIARYAVSPALPTGLSLNAQTGAISGTPANAQVPTAYVVSGSNSAGTVQAPLEISVIPAASGEWLPGGNLFEGRASHTATLLSNGEVLVTGGSGLSGVLSSAERFNPANGVWARAGKMQTARTEHTATRLDNGSVLVAGGRYVTGGETTRTAELYDPATGGWTPVGNMKRGRHLATSTLMPDGRVLVVGGIEEGDFGTFVAEAELFDPVSRTWTTAGSLNIARAHHIATLLPGGKVLVAGGSSTAGVTATAEIYDAPSGKWTLVRDMHVQRSTPTATMLSTGKVLVVGGNSSSLTAEQYDPVTGVWTLTGPMVMPRRDSQTTRLPDGRVVVTGNYDASYEGNGTSAEVFDPATGNWAAIANMSDPRSMHTATLLNDGSVLVAGSYHHTRTYSSSERFR